MKKILCILTILFMGANASATITANLSVQDVVPSSQVAGYYDVTLFAGSMTNSGCSGVFSFTFQRTLTPNDINSWTTVSATLITVPCQSPGDVCSGFYKVSQPDGYKYYYKVKVIFNPDSILIGDPCHTNPNETKSSISNDTAISVDLTMSACFNILNIFSTATVDSYYGPQQLKNLCGPTVNIDGNCSNNETGYFVSLYEFDLVGWQFGTLYYSGWVSGTGQAGVINLNTLISQNNANTNFTPHTSFDSHKTYIVTLSVGSIWHSATSQFFKVKTCFTGKETAAAGFDSQIENNNPKEPKFTLYPNPTNGIVTLEKKEKKLVLKTITVYDTNNVAIMTKSLENVNSQEINVAALRQGIYVINVETDEGVIVDKLVRN